MPISMGTSDRVRSLMMIKLLTVNRRGDSIETTTIQPLYTAILNLMYRDNKSNRPLRFSPETAAHIPQRL